MENPEGVLNLLDEFAKLKSKEIPSDLEEYLSYVATSGDPVYQWSLIKSLYRQKLINVITEFYEMCPVVDIPRCPNVDPFNYETMKNSLLKRLDSFSSAPFTIQRISELLTTPRKQYNRVDKFMRAIEKNIWVVSTREPGSREPINSQETSSSLVNGVTTRVCVTVKHPKRVKSIEERIKSGHPQLIDDDEEEEEEEEEEIDEYEQMEEDTTAEILPNTEADDSSLQCTSVKDLIEKYENGTIFSNAEEKTEFEEKSEKSDLDGTATSNSAPCVSSQSATGTAVITSTDPTITTPTMTATDILPENSSQLQQPTSDSTSDLSNLNQTKEISPILKEADDSTPDSFDSSAENTTPEPVSSAKLILSSLEIKDEKIDNVPLDSNIAAISGENSASETETLTPVNSEPLTNEEDTLAMMIEESSNNSPSNASTNVESVLNDSNTQSTFGVPLNIELETKLDSDTKNDDQSI